MPKYCQPCNRIFSSSSNGLRHMRVMHQGGTQPYSPASMERPMQQDGTQPYKLAAMETPMHQDRTQPSTHASTESIDRTITMKLQCPFSMMVSGPSQSGKTNFTLKLIEANVFSQPPEEIYFCYAEFQPAYCQLPKSVIMCQGLPPMDQLREQPNQHKLVIIDDLMMEASAGTELTALTTRGCHHLSCSIIFLVQNAFYKNLRTSRLNMTYLVLFKSPGDKSQIRVLARQMYPTKPSILEEAYQDATNDSYGYLLVDLHQKTPDKLRLKSHILPGETTMVYVPKNFHK